LAKWLNVNYEVGAKLNYHIWARGNYDAHALYTASADLDTPCSK